MNAVSRRRFLQLSSAGALTLMMARLGFAPPGASAALDPAAGGGRGGTGVGANEYGDWRDLYREAWSWDRIAKGTHTNANCVSACAWNLYVRDDVVWREEQAGSYDEGCGECPDFNPRGCQKGACASHLSIGPTRLRYPLKRVGPRGSRRWKRISWHQALDEIADGLVDAVERAGGAGVIAELGPEIDYGPNSAAALRFFKMLGGPITDNMAMIGDVAFGGTITLGTPHTDGSSDDWFRSRHIVLWAFNPVYTRIPDAHFLNEARYNGTRITSIAPDYNASTVHADTWISPRPGTDAALAMSAVQVVLDEGLHDQAYLIEQTDLPFLVRKDNGRFLRESDLGKRGSEQVFYVLDSVGRGLVKAPGTGKNSQETLDWGETKPTLSGSSKVSLPGGVVVEVETVFDRLKRLLDAEYRPEAASKVTGISAATIRRFARDFASAPSALILSQYGSCKFYHSDLLQRAQILLASVTGNLGRAGGGWRSGAFVGMEGWPVLSMQRDLGLIDLIILATRSYFRDPEDNLADFSKYFVPSGLWHYVHGGLSKVSAVPAYGDPMLADGPAQYVDEALNKKFYPINTEVTPTFMLSIFGNVVRHSRSGHLLVEHLWPKLDTVVHVDFRMNETALVSDIVLPAAGWYEKVGFKYIPSLIPYVTLGDRAVSPAGESKPEWEIFHHLAHAVARRARERGVGAYSDYLGVDRNLTELGDGFSDDGRFGAHDEEKLADFILTVSAASKGMDLEGLRKSGTERIKSLGQQGATTGIYSDYSEREPVVPLRWFVEQKKPYPTLTGRQQFYIDHRWFLKLGEELPRFKEPPAAGGDFPLTLSGGHARWSIHSIWRDNELMLRLQRGEPVVLLGIVDAAERGIDDYDRVQVYNDVSNFIARAKIVPSSRPGVATVYHSWEPFQFEEGRSHQHVAPAPLKVTQLAADYGHLAWSFAHYEPGQAGRDTRVDVVRLP